LSDLRLTKRGTGSPLTEPVVRSPAARAPSGNAARQAANAKPPQRRLNATLLCVVTAIW
jgi:hypothetical protein